MHTDPNQAQDIDEEIGAGGIKRAQLGGLVPKSGIGTAAGSALFLNLAGVLVGGEVAGLGPTIKGTDYATAAFGYGVVLAAGGNVRSEFDDAAVHLIPLSGFFSRLLEEWDQIRPQSCRERCRSSEHRMSSMSRTMMHRAFIIVAALFFASSASLLWLVFHLSHEGRDIPDL